MTDLVTREAESIISSRDPEKPLYLQLAHLAPHSSDAEEVMEVRDWQETNATLGHIRDVNRRKYASMRSDNASIVRLLGLGSDEAHVSLCLRLELSFNRARRYRVIGMHSDALFNRELKVDRRILRGMETTGVPRRVFRGFRENRLRD